MAQSTGEDLKEFYDIDLIKKLVWDVPGDYSDQQTLTNSKVTNALAAASGRIFASIRQGEMYDPVELQTELNAAGNEDALAFYKSIECSIAMAWLLRRKPMYGTPELRDPILSESADYLDKLRRGVNVLGIESNIQAGGGEPVLMPEPEVFNIQTNSITSKATGSLYPYRNNQR